MSLTSIVNRVARRLQPADAVSPTIAAMPPDQISNADGIVTHLEEVQREQKEIEARLSRRISRLEKRFETEIKQLWRLRDPTDLHADSDFLPLAKEVLGHERTLLGYDRLFVLWQACQNTAKLTGAGAEIGTFRGGSSYFLASALKRLVGEEVAFHVFDTFEGHPGEEFTEWDEHQRPGGFNTTSLEQVSEYLAPFERVTIHKGPVGSIIPGLEEQTYRVVHIDVDLYQA